MDYEFYRGDFVNAIYNNLRDRYKEGFPILKELIQNADDAKATGFVFGYHNGWPDQAKNPLLQCPALWVLNNGGFTDTDAQAIHSFGINSKAGESGTIGKFGLGMKSIFHWCEAFFYVASNEKGIQHKVLSPWFQSNKDDMSEMHQLWCHINKKEKLEFNIFIEKIIHKEEKRGFELNDEQPSWFFMWIPLRQRGHVPKNNAPIINTYPEENKSVELNFLNQAETFEKIAYILPLLRNLQFISYAQRNDQESFFVQLNIENGQRLTHELFNQNLTGWVENGGSKVNALHFSTQKQVKINDDYFNELQNSDKWPKTGVKNEGGKREAVPDKAQPEAAVMISHTKKRQGRLIIQWAVFLPVEEDEFSFYEIPIFNSSTEYHIVLHSQFFIDAGRRGIEGIKYINQPLESAENLPIRWNQLLAQKLVFPLILPQLDNYVKQHQIKHDEISALVQAFAATPFFRSFKEFICSEHSYVCQLKETGPEWSLLEQFSHLQMRTLPPPKNNDHARPWKAVPSLRKIQNTFFIDQYSPKLSAQSSQWNEEDIINIISSISHEMLMDKILLQYLVEFLQPSFDNGILKISVVQQSLVKCLRKTIPLCDWDLIHKNKAIFENFISLLSKEYIFSFGPLHGAETALPKKIWVQLINIDTPILFLPKDLVTKTDLQVPDENTIEQCLSVLNTNYYSAAEYKRACLSAAKELLKLLHDKDKSQRLAYHLLKRHPDWYIIEVWDAKQEKEVACSLNEIYAAEQKGYLFKNADKRNSKHEIISALVKLLPDARPLVIEKEWASWTMENDLLLPMSNDIIKIVAGIGKSGIAPRLSDEDENRRKFLDKINGDLKNNSDSNIKKFIRYLMHGNDSNFNDLDTTLWYDPLHDKSPWVKIWQMVLPDSKKWTILKKDLVNRVVANLYQFLTIKGIEKDNVINQLREQKDFSGIDGTKFTTDEIDTILGEFSDEKIWRNLPLHKDQHEKHGSLDATAYFGEDPELPKGVGLNIRFIQKSCHENHYKKQKERIQPWNHNAAIQIILKSDKPEKYWSYILDNLSKNSSDATIKAMQETAWLPLQQQENKAIRLNQLLSIQGINDDLAELTKNGITSWIEASNLNHAVKEHENFGILLSNIKQNEDALPALAELMQDNSLSIGDNAIFTESQSKESITYLAKLEKILPAWKWVKKATEHLEITAVLEKLLPLLRQALTSETCEEILNYIAKEEAGEQPLSMVWQEIMCIYLQEWVQSSTSKETLKERLPSVKLLSEDGYFLSPKLLVYGVSGSPSSEKINNKVAEILHDIIYHNNGFSEKIDKENRNYQYSSTDSLDTKKLERWAEAWRGTSIAPAAGALMGLFGLQAAEIAERWLPPVSYREYLEKLNWKDPGREDKPDGRWEWMGGKNIEQGFKALQPKLTIIEEGSSVDVCNLLGDPISIILKPLKEVETLLADHKWLGGNYVSVILRNIDENFSNLEIDDQKRILKITAENLFKELYNQPHANFDALWEKFNKSDQVQLNIARQLILDGLPQQLEQLQAAKKLPKIKESLNNYDKARRDAAANINDVKAADAKTQKLHELAELLRKDADVQKAVLDGIREKLKQNQYEISSIPFEILQNADDAVTDYQKIQDSLNQARVEPDDIGRFVLCANEKEQRILLLHWGRPINYTGHSNAPEHYDYAKDLEHMLMLNASGKSQESDNNTTGKFGLGFKSVLLATDVPIVSSGDLEFEIIAGCLPEKQQRTHSEWAKKQKLQYSNGISLRCTAVELPMLKNAQKVFARFERLAGLCTVFLQQIRHIEIQKNVEHPSKHQWKPEVLLDRKDLQAWCEIGKVQLPTQSNGMRTSHLLVLHRRNHFDDHLSSGTLVLKLEHGQVKPFVAAEHPDIPAIWVNAPTGGTTAHGFLLNAKFEVDTGRGNLPNGKEASQRNNKTAENLAKELSPFISHWFDDTLKDWPTWANHLQTGNYSLATVFWLSWWQTLMGDAPHEDASVEAKLTDLFACHLFSEFIQRKGQVPNGLTGESLKLVPVKSLRLVVENQHQNILPVLKKWPQFLERYPDSSWCSTSVMNWLKRSCINLSEELQKFDEKLVVELLGEPAKLAPENISNLMEVIEKWPSQNKDSVWRLGLKAQDIHLKNYQGEWKPLKNFCAFDSKNPLILFAPPATRLDTSYEQQADWENLSRYLSFLSPQPVDVARWCIQAHRKDAQKAVLDYLLQNLNDPVWQDLKRDSDYPSSWMKRLGLHHSLLSIYSDVDQKSLLNNLGLLTDEYLRKYYSEKESAVIKEDESNDKLPAGLTIKAIYRWWQAEREGGIQEHDKLFWPQAIDRRKLTELPIDRSAWMALFTLAVSRRYGRTKDEQHRGFVEFLDQRGWWNTIAWVDPKSDAASWMNILHEYAEGSQFNAEYEMWMDSFPRIYRMARWCDDYAELFCSLDRRSANQANSEQLLTPAIDSSLSGSGFDVPTLHRTLKKGYPLVIRELLRFDVLKGSPITYQLAYSPSESTKKFLQKIMPDAYIEHSQHIYHALSDELGEEEATFLGAYDIPLILLSRNRELQIYVAKQFSDINDNDVWDDEE